MEVRESDLISRKEIIDRLERVIQNGVPSEDGMHPITAEVVLEVVRGLSELGPNLVSLGTDCISRQQAIDALDEYFVRIGELKRRGLNKGEKAISLDTVGVIKTLPSAQPEIVRCKDCIYYDPPHVENNGVRYEYDEMPADAFDALGTGLVNAEYGINIGGRCCVDYYCKNYSDDKRVFVREDNYCGRAERRTDE